MAPEMHPEYFETRFRASPAVVWPREFAVISAYATTGESWPLTANEAADRALERELWAMRVWLARITGYSPRTGHAEPSWSAAVGIEPAREIGRRYRQDAVYHVVGDTLFCVLCDGPSEPVVVGPFRERIDAV